mgnify:CR=1 FL=1
MFEIILEITIINVSVCILHKSIPIFLIFQPQSIINIPIGISEASIAWSLAILPITFIHTILVYHSSLPLNLSVNKLAFIKISKLIYEHTLTVHDILKPLTFVHCSILKLLEWKYLSHFFWPISPVFIYSQRIRPLKFNLFLIKIIIVDLVLENTINFKLFHHSRWLSLCRLIHYLTF